ncbi:MAG TPA: cytochrome c oxidase subunit 3 [Terriglobales bacterium]|nr:cytochrome c oxidase subunit 3 [Terriglobales bacterium]
MATTIYEPRQIGPRLPDDSGRNLTPAGGAWRAVQDFPLEPAQTGIWVALGAITMSFAALTSALVVRQGTAPDWRHMTLPPILYLNTLALVGSSVTLEVARGKVAAHARGIKSQISVPMRWLVATLTLGLLFVLGQYGAWLQLRAAGLYLDSNPNSSFFYVFTGVHAAHVLGGLWGMVYVIRKLHRGALRRSTFAAEAQYWHFMGLLWLYLLLLLWTKL